MDKEGMTQEECSNRMGVARTTVTSIYDSARKKIAESFDPFVTIIKILISFQSL